MTPMNLRSTLPDSHRLQIISWQQRTEIQVKKSLSGKFFLQAFVHFWMDFDERKKTSQ
jgi:hypothetical protein